jgi:hypothetical protein
MWTKGNDLLNFGLNLINCTVQEFRTTYVWHLNKATSHSILEANVSRFAQISNRPRFQDIYAYMYISEASRIHLSWCHLYAK